MPLAEDLQDFISYFRREIELVSSLAGDESIDVGSSDPAIRVATHKKILFSAVLDALANIRYHGGGLGNRQRFTAIIRDHSSWTEGALVSVPILRERLGAASASQLIARLDANLARHGTIRGNSLTLADFDEPFFTLALLAQTGIEREHLNASEHFELFYKYRNFIVHEFREPGYAIEAFANGGSEPRYHSYVEAGARWHLLYPVGFFRCIAETVVHSLGIWFTANAVNPDDRVADSSTWFT